MSALEELGRFVAQIGTPAPDLRRRAELHIIDSIGAWIAGAATSEGRALLHYHSTMRAGGHSPVAVDLGTHCALARLSEIDDIDLPSMTTPGGIIVPGALTLMAAAPGATGDDVIAAILAGYEVMARVGRALDGPAILYRGIWPTYFTAPIGIAAVLSRLLKLDPPTTANALALALTFAAPGVGHHNAPTTARWLAVGNAARNGLAAALAAQQGFTADVKLIEGSFFPGIYGVTPDIAALTGGLGEVSALNDVSFKPWCAARQTMAATQALKDIIASGITANDITEVEASVLPPHVKMIDHGVVAGDRASHLTSLPYCMAVAAVAPELAFDVQQSPPDLPPAVRAFMGKIKVKADESLLADYPRRWRARVRVVSGTGRREWLTTHVPGDPVAPFDRARVQAKFLRFVGAALGVEKAEELVKVCSEAVASGRFATVMSEIEAARSHLSPQTESSRL